MSNLDERCCGSGVCIINLQGECWCGQVWNGTKMVSPNLQSALVEPKDEKTMLANDTDPIIKASK